MGSMVMRIEHTGRVAVAFHDEHSPTDAEWDAWVALCRLLKSQHQAEAACLIRTLGGAPNVRQRADLGKALGGSAVRAAVLTSSAITRGVVTAIAWLGVPVRAFRPDAWDEIRDYLKLSRDECGDVQAALLRMSTQDQVNTAAHL
jgi:hypothetical protein